MRRARVLAAAAVLAASAVPVAAARRAHRPFSALQDKVQAVLLVPPEH